MRLDDILEARAVRTLPRLGSKKKLFCELARIASDLHGMDEPAAFAALQEREALGSTCVGDGVALPHARLAGLDRVHGVFVRLDAPLDFDAVDRKPVDLVFALFAPEAAGVAHLKALALVSRTLRDAGLRDKLRANDEPSVLHAVLTEASPDSQAA
jgi:PTS system nitrogen regulatory IIA component